MVVDSDDKVRPDECVWETDLDPVVETDECDESFGAGNLIKVNYGPPDVYGYSNAEGEERCELGEGRRFLRSSDPDFLEKFECIAGVGTLGTGRERPITSAVHALREEKELCNAGFLRDDAILGTAPRGSVVAVHWGWSLPPHGGAGWVDQSNICIALRSCKNLSAGKRTSVGGTNS